MAVIRARKNRETERQRVLALIRNEICANDAIESIQELCERAFEAAQLCLPEGSAFFVGAVQSPTGSKAGGLGLAPEPGPGSHSPEASSRGGVPKQTYFPADVPVPQPVICCVAETFTRTAPAAGEPPVAVGAYAHGDRRARRRDASAERRAHV